jgi:hypothetical protein
MVDLFGNNSAASILIEPDHSKTLSLSKVGSKSKSMPVLLAVPVGGERTRVCS